MTTTARQIILTLGLTISTLGGCGVADSPSTPATPASTIELDGTCTAFLDGAAAEPGGWTWRDADGDAGRAEFRRDAHGWVWRFPRLPGTYPVGLEPDDAARWHGMTVPVDSTAVGRWLPLPRRPIRSPFYADRLDLLLTLTAPLHDGLVRRWAHEPVPVAPSTAVGGDLDLGVCLAEAVVIWNAGDAELLTLETAGFAEGVRLIHYPDRELHPPMWVRLLRRDGEGRPLLMHVTAGDQYRRAEQARYARRAFVHELAHVLQLWGHSLDPAHVLWRWGPVVDAPSEDEREALRLWQSLPEGLDLKRYGRRGEIEPPGATCDQADAVATKRARARAARSILRKTGTPRDSMASTSGS